MFFSRVIRNTGLVEPPSKSAIASKYLRLDDDAIEIELLQLFNNKNLILLKYQKQNSWLYYNPSKDLIYT